jgi:hypothetical protein
VIEAYQWEKIMPLFDAADRAAMERLLLLGLEVALDLKFGAKGMELMPEIREIRDLILLGRIFARIETARSPAEVRRMWTRKRRPKPAEAMTEGEAPPEAATPAPRRSGRRRS